MTPQQEKLAVRQMIKAGSVTTFEDGVDKVIIFRNTTLIEKLWMKLTEKQ